MAGYTSRFVTVTGNAISGTGIEDRTEALAEILEKYMVRPGKSVSHASAPGSYLSDDSVLTKISAYKQAEKFNSLWNGNIPDGKSHSEADAALCAMLAFWCGGDTGQMDRLFRQSALMRDKWNRDDYREATLSKAVAMCAEFYRPVGTSSAYDDFNDLQQLRSTIRRNKLSRMRSTGRRSTDSSPRSSTDPAAQHPPVYRSEYSYLRYLYALLGIQGKRRH